MQKYRKAYYKTKELIKLQAYTVIILVGLRRTGKTTILKQLAESYNGYYVDFRNEKGDLHERYLQALDADKDLVLLDEVGYLPDFDLLLSSLVNSTSGTNKTVVLTSSSYGTLKQLASEQLGGGRSCVIEVFPLDFEEYLHFSNKIDGYNVPYVPTREDVENYYRLSDVPPGMKWIIDRKYMDDTFSDVEVARYNQYSGERNVVLTREQYGAALDIIAYTLNVPTTFRKFRNNKVGVQEFGATYKIDFSSSIISLAKNIMNGSVTSITVPELAHIIQALYHNGFLFVDLQVNEREIQQVDDFYCDFNSVETEMDLKGVMTKYSMGVISPLLHTRLLIDVEGIAKMVYTEVALEGELYELTLKSESLRRNGYNRMHTSHKYQQGVIQVDLYEPEGLLLEATIKNKTESEYNVERVFRNKMMIRVLTRESGYSYQRVKAHHRISYPEALLLLSSGKIYDLEPTKIESIDIISF